MNIRFIRSIIYMYVYSGKNRIQEKLIKEVRSMCSKAAMSDLVKKKGQCRIYKIFLILNRH